MFSTLLLLLSLLIQEETAFATPLIALREANNCGGCHKPGRGQKDFLWRRCTLDCQGCHVDPSGAGPRNEWGYYYENDQAAWINFIQPIDPLQDQSFFDAHYDGRSAQQKVAGQIKTFPMSSEATIRLKPLRKMLSVSYTSLLLGNPDDNLFRMVQEGDRRYRERYAVMVDALPLNTYIRAYKGQPMYGERRPNHTLWIRERIGLNPFSTTEAVEAGGTPNVPYWRVSRMKGDPYVAAAERQVGNSYHAGFRGVSYGWHLNTSGWDTRSESEAIKMHAVGAGGNLFGVILYGETNDRIVTSVNPELADDISPTRLQPSNHIAEYTIAYGGLRGVMLGAVKEIYHDDLRNSERLSYFLDLHPVPGLQVEFWLRHETGERDLTDALFILHLYVDL